jgi:hypothetical protein
MVSLHVAVDPLRVAATVMLSLTVFPVVVSNTEAVKVHAIVSVEGILDLTEMLKVTAKSPEEGASISGSS